MLKMRDKKINKLNFDNLESRCLLSSHDLIPTDGLVAYYPFNGNANDESGNGNNGIINGAVLTTDRFGNANKAFNFSGNDDYISAKDSSSLDITEQLTLSAWIDTENSLESGYIIKKGQSGGDENYSIFMINRDPIARVHASNGLYYSVRTSENTIGSAWTHSVGTYNGNQLSIYVNGILKNKGAVPRNLISNSSDLYIGLDFQTSEFQGKIDDIAIYNRSLSESEIQRLFNNKPKEESIIKKPVIIIPGILGSMPEGKSKIKDFGRFIRRVSVENNKIAIQPYNPEELTAEQIKKTYNKVIEDFISKGYLFCDLDNPNLENDLVNCDNANLFFAAYDWRLPVLLNPNNPQEILWDSDDNTFQSSAEYLDWWINLAKQKWLNNGGSENDFSVNIIAHSMGGLIARSYIEEADEAGHNAEKVDHLIMLGTPNHGSVSSYQFFDSISQKFTSGNISYIDNFFNHYLRLAIRSSVSNVERTYHLPRRSVKSEDLLASLNDLLPTFPFVGVGNNPLIIPRTNNLLTKLNNTIDDLTNTTDVLLIGGNNIATPIKAKLKGVVLGLETVINGDGVVLYDFLPGTEIPAGLLISNIESISFSGIRHNNLPNDQIIISKIFDEIFQ